jgi:hypothetical protein
MSAAALTPRVRILAVCDEVTPSDVEEGVFTLEGVRQHVSAESFPYLYRPSLFLLLSSPRRGAYRGRVLVVHEEADRTFRYLGFRVAFEEDHALLPLYLDLGECQFREPGRYTFQVWFSSVSGAEALKAEHPFHALLLRSE